MFLFSSEPETSATKVDAPKPFAPVFDMSPDAVQVEEGETAKFVTKIASDPPARVTWWLNGKVVSNVSCEKKILLPDYCRNKKIHNIFAFNIIIIKIMYLKMSIESTFPRSLRWADAYFGNQESAKL